MRRQRKAPAQPTPPTVAERKLLLDVRRLRRVAHALQLSGTVAKVDELIEQVQHEVSTFPAALRRVAALPAPAPLRKILK